MLHGFGFSRRPYAEPGGRVHSFILAEVEQDQRSRVVLRRSWAELDGSGAPDSGLGGEGAEMAQFAPKRSIGFLHSRRSSNTTVATTSFPGIGHTKNSR